MSLFNRRIAQAARGYATQATAVRPPLTLAGLPGKYASSAYVAALSKDAKTLEKVEGDLKTLHQVLSSAENAQVSAFINNPTLSTKEKTDGLNQLFSAAKSSPNEITKNLFQVLAENGRLADAPKVIEGFQELMSAYRGEVEVIVTSAQPLDKSIASRLESALKGSQIAQVGGGKSLKITQKVNPAIQGGLVVDFGDRTVDLSVASRVNKLNSLLSEGV